MTWRRFLTLLRGLSTQATSVVSAVNRTEFGRRGAKEHLVEGAKAAQSAFVGLFGGRKRTG